MLIAITGTPGTGKSSLSKLLKKKGFIVLEDKFFYLKKFPNLILEEDKELKTKIVDIEALTKIIKPFKKSNKVYFIDSHFSHLLNPDFVIVLERDLKELKKEYKKRGYDEIKTKDNLEAEAFKICRLESEELLGKKRVKVFNNYWKAYNYIVKNLYKKL
ncbi:MAG: AAA family ATPase [Nanoarchaeota archaeon]